MMLEKNTAHAGNDPGVDESREITLFDISMILWRRKYLVLIGVLIFAMASILLSSLTKPVYLAKTVLSPGVLRIENNGNRIFIDSAKNIKSLIEAGTFDSTIIDGLKKDVSDDVPREIKLKTSVSGNSEVIKVQYETTDKAVGVYVLNHLVKLLTAKYKNLVEFYKNEQMALLNGKKTELKKAEFELANINDSIEKIKRLISKQSEELSLFVNKTGSLMSEHKRFIDNSGDKGNSMAELLYTIMVQQGTAAIKLYKNEIHDYEMERDEQVLKRKTLDRTITNLQTQIEVIKFKINQIQNVQVLQPPITEGTPIKPKTLTYLVLSVLIGGGVMLMLALFVEYINSSKIRDSINAFRSKAGAPKW